MATEHERLDDQRLLGDRPRLIFSTELDAAGLLETLRRPDVLERLAAQGCAVALLLPELDDARAQA